MIRKYRYGNPAVNTDAAVIAVAEEKGKQSVFSESVEEGKYVFDFTMDKDDCVFGLGEQMRGINKRGWVYESWNIDDPIHTESRTSLYTSHNFFVVNGKKGTFGAFFDCGGKD